MGKTVSLVLDKEFIIIVMYSQTMGFIYNIELFSAYTGLIKENEEAYIKPKIQNRKSDKK